MVLSAIILRYDVA